LARAFSGVKIQLMDAPELFRCCSQAFAYWLARKL